MIDHLLYDLGPSGVALVSLVIALALAAVVVVMDHSYGDRA